MSSLNSNNGKYRVCSIESNHTEEVNGGFIDVRLPGFSISGGFETSSMGSLGELATSVVSSAQNLIQVGKMAYCAGQMIANPSMMLGVLDTLAGNALSAATEMAGRLANLVKGQLMQGIGQVVGSVSGLIGSAFGFLGSIFNLVSSIKNFVEGLFNLGESDWDAFMSEEDCEYVFATMAACMMNKFLGSKMRKLEGKISNEIIKSGDKMNSFLADQLGDVNSVSSYLERERFMMEKATKQINGINNLIS